MTLQQEDAIYDFLDIMSDPFDLDMIMAYIRFVTTRLSGLSGEEVSFFLNNRRLAFNMGKKKWMSRRGFFENLQFVICPSRLELLNGILIPGHRCVPFANPNLLPHEYGFQWKGEDIPKTTTEGDPEEFYPYYSIYGEEYAPQYVARDNPENEQAFFSDPYDDPQEVSIHTFDMRNIYRETSFVPGDRFIVRTVDWNKGVFSLEKADQKDFSREDLYAWLMAAEKGFLNSINYIGPGSSTDEQIAYAYWYGGERMIQVPAYSLEEFLYEKTDNIEITHYGIETRFWHAGREINDMKKLDGIQPRPGKTPIEKLLYVKKIPLSAFVLEAFIRDLFYRGELNSSSLLSSLTDRIIPKAAIKKTRERKILEDYIKEELHKLHANYSPFINQEINPIRQRAGELLTAIIDLAIRLDNENMDPSWLPKQTYIILSQILSHAVNIMEDMDTDETIKQKNQHSDSIKSEVYKDIELQALDNSIDSMIETYEDIKSQIEESLENYRKNRFSIVKTEENDKGEWLIQLGIGGTEVWRRIILPEHLRLDDIHNIIQMVFGWKNTLQYYFSAETILDGKLSLKELGDKKLIEILYEYGSKWTVKIMLLTRYSIDTEKPVRCVAGENAAPPEAINGPLRFRRFISALSSININNEERQKASIELGRDFKQDYYNLDALNRELSLIMEKKK